MDCGRGLTRALEVLFGIRPTGDSAIVLGHDITDGHEPRFSRTQSKVEKYNGSLYRRDVQRVALSKELGKEREYRKLGLLRKH